MSCPPCTFHAGSSNKLGNSFLPFNSLKMTESDQPLSTSQTMFQIFLSPMYNQAQALKNFTKYPKTSRVLKMNSRSPITCYTSLLSFFKNNLNWTYPQWTKLNLLYLVIGTVWSGSIHRLRLLPNTDCEHSTRTLADWHQLFPLMNFSSSTWHVKFIDVSAYINESDHRVCVSQVAWYGPIIVQPSGWWNCFPWLRCAHPHARSLKLGGFRPVTTNESCIVSCVTLRDRRGFLNIRKYFQIAFLLQ